MLQVIKASSIQAIALYRRLSVGTGSGLAHTSPEFRAEPILPGVPCQQVWGEGDCHPMPHPGFTSQLLSPGVGSLL